MNSTATCKSKTSNFCTVNCRLSGQRLVLLCCYLPPTKEVNVFARVCLPVGLSFSKITQKRILRRDNLTYMYWPLQRGVVLKWFYGPPLQWRVVLQFTEPKWLLLRMDRCHQRHSTRHYSWPGSIHNLHKWLARNLWTICPYLPFCRRCRVV